MYAKVFFPFVFGGIRPGIYDSDAVTANLEYKNNHQNHIEKQLIERLHNS